MVVMTGGAAITMDNDLVLLPQLFDACTVKLNVPAALGTPDINPAPDNVNPVGKLPLLTVHVMGVVPVAASC